MTYIMKKNYLWISVLCLAVAFTACKSNKTGQVTKEEEKTEETVIPGSDRDEHGCIGSAGYTWSELKKECIRPFEIGLKLNGITANNQNYAAYVVFASDSAKVELFIPEEKGGVILDQTNDGWKNDTFFLTSKNGKWSISKSGTDIFSSK